MKRKSCSQWAMALVSVLTSVWCLNAREGVLNGAVKAPQAQSGTPTEPEKHALTVAERADLFMARKQYADAAETYGQALRRPGLPGEETASRVGVGSTLAAVKRLSGAYCWWEAAAHYCRIGSRAKPLSRLTMFWIGATQRVTLISVSLVMNT